ncbi:MAG: hypothetical protein ACKPBA_03800 [Planctomycetota bacterium]
MRVPHLLLTAALLVACKPGLHRDPAPTPKPTTPMVPPTPAGLTGRWIFSPGDSVIPDRAPATDTQAADDAKDAAMKEGEARTSPAGAVLTLGEGGVMIAREGDFVRRGLWKFENGSLRIVVEPPPRRLEMGFLPEIEADRLTLNGADEMVLVYHRDPFIGVGATP